MTTEYTRKERDTITAAWSHLIHYAEGNSAMGVPQQLEDALKDERRQVSSPTVAKALLLRTMVETCDPDHRTGRDPAELWGFRRAHRDMIAFAWMHKDGLTDGEASVTFQARQAADAHEKASRRALDALKD